MKSIKTPFVLTLIAALAISATLVGCSKSDTDKMSDAADKAKDATADAAAKTADAAKDTAVAAKDAVTNAVSK